MSIKIYDGCLIDVHTLLEYQEFINDMRERLRDEILNVVVMMATANAVADIDHLALTGEDVRNNKDISFIMNGVEDYTHLYDTNRSALSITHEAYISVFMVDDRVLVIPYMEGEIKNIFMNHEKVIPYAYWNNTDPDEDCSDEEWLQREQDWGKALYTAEGIPSECGSVVEFSAPDHKFIGSFVASNKKFADLVSIQLPELEYRYMEHIKKEFFTEKVKSAKDSGLGERWAANYLDWCKEYETTYIGTDEFIERCDYFRATLPRITIELLYKKDLTGDML